MRIAALGLVLSVYVLPAALFGASMEKTPTTIEPSETPRLAPLAAPLSGAIDLPAPAAAAANVAPAAAPLPPVQALAAAISPLTERTSIAPAAGAPSAAADKLLQDLFFDGRAPAGGLEDWITLEQGRAMQWLFENLHPEGAAPGVAQASPQRDDPNYGYDWVRDTALSMKIVANLYRKAPDGPARKFYYDTLHAYALRARTYQTSPTQAGLGEPKFNLDGSVFNGPWGRPQNDAPAARAIALTHFAETLLKEGREKEVRELLYQGELPASTVVKADLEYVAHHWADGSFDAWEEVYAQSHFYNAMLQRRALIEGARLAQRLKDEGAARFYEAQAQALQTRIEKHWDEKLGLIVPSLNAKGKPGNDGGLDYKREHIDSIVFFGINRGYVGDGFFGPTDDRVLRTLWRQESRFREIYPINQRPEIPGLGIGRYPEDRFYDGNPWFIATEGFAESYHYAAKEFKKAGVIKVTARSLPFFQALGLASAGRLRKGLTVTAADPLFAQIISAMHQKADAFIQRVRYHANREDGSWSEQFDRHTGLERSAKKLMWNSAEWIRVMDNRREAEEDVDLGG